MASVFKPTYTKTDPKTGKKVKKKLKKWYVKYRDADGTEKRVPGFTDKVVTQQLAAKLERAAELGRMGISDPFEEQRRRPLAQHVDDFEEHLRAKNNSPEHVRLTMDRLRTAINWCGYGLFDDVSPSRVESFLADLRERGRSPQTSNHYLSAIKQFCHWMVLDRRCSVDPIFHLRKLNVKTDRRHDRRALESEEFTRLIEAAMNGPVIEAVEGQDRAIIYIFAAWTGYRRKELASITLRSLSISGDVPAVEVEAAYSKRRRTDTIPLHPVVVARLTTWLAEKGSVDRDAPLFPLQTAAGKMRKTSKMMKRDLGRAREKWIAEAKNDEELLEREQSDFLSYCDEDGLFADFHANRHTFITNLGQSGVPLTVAQSLARHGDVNLTANIYTHIGISDQVAAIAHLPTPPPMVHAIEADSQQLPSTAIGG